MKAIKGFFKFIFWTVIVLVLLAVAVVATLPWWGEPVVTKTSNYAVPKIIKTDFALNQFALNQYLGVFHLGDLKMANPEGFDKENCLELDSFDVKLDPISCFTKKIHIEKIVIDGLRVVVDFPAAANFQKIGQNAQESLGCDKCETKEEVKEPEKKEEPKEEAKEQVKVVIDLIEFKNLKVTYGAAPIVVPDFTLTGIGKDDGGLEIGDAIAEVFKAVCDKLGIVVGVVLDAGKAVIDAGVQAANEAVDAGMQAANATIEVGTKAVNDVAEAVGNIDAAGAVSAVTEGASSAMETVTDLVGDSGAANAVGGAAEAAADAAGAAVDAVGKGLQNVGDGAGEAAGAAVDAVKGLFK